MCLLPKRRSERCKRAASHHGRGLVGLGTGLWSGFGQTCMQPTISWHSLSASSLPACLLAVRLHQLLPLRPGRHELPGHGHQGGQERPPGHGERSAHARSACAPSACGSAPAIRMHTSDAAAHEACRGLHLLACERTVDGGVGAERGKQHAHGVCCVQWLHAAMRTLPHQPLPVMHAINACVWYST